MIAAPSAGRALLILARLRLRRMVNQIASGFLTATTKKGKSRAATPGRRRFGWVLSVLMLAMMSFSMVFMALEGLRTLHCRLDRTALCAQGETMRRAAFEKALSLEIAGAPFSGALLQGLDLQMLFVTLLAVMIPLSARQFNGADWDLEWLVTMPLRRTPLLWGRVIERGVTGMLGLLFLAPLLSVAAWHQGWRWGAPLLGTAAALPLVAMAGAVITLVDTGLRMALKTAQLRNVQAAISLLTMPLMYLAMAPALKTQFGFLFDWARAMPAWAGWAPPGLAMRLATARTLEQGAPLALLLCAQALCIMALCVQLLRWQLRDGIVSGGARESGRSVRKPARPGAPSRFGFLAPIQRRELLLLARDRNFMVQCLLVPVMAIGAQLLVNGAFNDLSRFAARPALMASMAFVLGAYMLMMSALQTLNTEGQALWLLYTFPQAMQRNLMQKTRMWAGVALLYPLAVYALGWYGARGFPWESLQLLPLVLLGVPIYAFIATALGVFASDPLAHQPQHKVNPSYVYLYMLLSGLYTYSILAAQWSQKLAGIVLTVALAQALWQKARDHLPYLLDASAAPPARVSSADGMIAALLFFVLQGLVLALADKEAGGHTLADMTVAFVIAGVLTFALMRLAYWRLRTRDVPVLVRREGRARALGWGLGMGMACAAAGLAYMALARHFGWLPPQPAQQWLLVDPRWLLLLAVLAAPLCEEFIFRGLIFAGMRRSLPLLPAMLVSAGLFAAVHPPASMLPVFGLGLGAALAYERTRMLIAPIVVHALYNAVVVGAQFHQNGLI